MGWKTFQIHYVFLNHIVVKKNMGKQLIASKTLLIWPEKKCIEWVEMGVEVSCNWFLFTSNPATATSN